MAKKSAVTACREAKLRLKLTAQFNAKLKRKLAERDAKWKKRIAAVKKDAAEKRDAARERTRATKQRKTDRFWARKINNGSGNVPSRYFQ